MMLQSPVLPKKAETRACPESVRKRYGAKSRGCRNSTIVSGGNAMRSTEYKYVEAADELIELEGPGARFFFVELRNDAEARRLELQPFGLGGAGLRCKHTGERGKDLRRRNGVEV